eukprot:Lithocolla_globosa_v1_NODE_1347_length_2649_cov_74.772552.p2 type:complete len:129 gc:universal NODE_1347_length_2649_cov_74.772552:2144-2530(+)
MIEPVEKFVQTMFREIFRSSVVKPRVKLVDNTTVLVNSVGAHSESSVQGVKNCQYTYNVQHPTEITQHIIFGILCTCCGCSLSGRFGYRSRINLFGFRFFLGLGHCVPLTCLNQSRAATKRRQNFLIG